MGDEVFCGCKYGVIAMVQGIILADTDIGHKGLFNNLFYRSGRSVLNQLIQLLRSFELNCSIVTRRTGENFRQCEVIQDRLGACGFLGGLWSAMDRYPGDSLLVLSCEMPLLSREQIAALLAGSSQNTSAVCFQNGITHPFPGMYSPALKSNLRNALVRDELSAAKWVEGLNQKTIIQWRGADKGLVNANY